MNRIEMVAACGLALGLLSSADAQPVIEPDKLLADFGNREFSGGVSFVVIGVDIFNRGDSDLVIGTISEPRTPFRITNDQCSGRVVVPSGHCDMDVEILLTLGEFSDAVGIPSNDPESPLLNFPVYARVVETLFAGDVDGIAHPVSMRCENLTTGQTVIEVLNDPARWDCVQAGLEVESDDRVRVSLAGLALRDFPPVPARNIAADSRNPDPAPAAAGIIVTPALVDFGRMPLLSGEQTEMVTVRNTGPGAVTIIETATNDRLLAPFFVTTDRCSFETLQPGATCDLIIGVRAEPGAYMESFSVTTETAVATVEVAGQFVPGLISGRTEGLGPRAFFCRNPSTGQAIFEDFGFWDCSGAGLTIERGDLVVTGVRSFKD